MKQIKLTFLLAVLMSMVGARALAYDFAAKNADGVTIYYNKINDKEAEVTYNNADKYSGHVVIPNRVYGRYNVSRIGSSAFHSCTSLTSVDITDYVTSIGAGAFCGCTSLISVTIPNSVTSIGYQAFEDCSALRHINIPNSVRVIESEAFAGTAWYNNQPDGVVYAGLFAYNYKGTMPENAHITIKEGTQGIAEYAFKDCTGLTSIYIPQSVNIINRNAFSGCKGLTSFTIPDGVTTICDYAFWYCSGLTSVTFGKNVMSIGKDVFYGCPNLTSVTINSNNLVSANYSAQNPLQNVLGIEMKSCVLGEDVTNIGNNVFYGCKSLTSISLPNGVINIGYRAFQNCSALMTIDIPNSVTNIGTGAFCGCTGLTSINIPISISKIEENTFIDCSSLISVTIPNSVTSIGKGAFYDCSGLTSITIGQNVTSIGAKAFYGCTNLNTVISFIENPINSPINGINSSSSVFSAKTFNNAILNVPIGTIEKYQSTNGWKDFVHIEEFDPAGIINVNREAITNNRYYTLDGREVELPTKGIYILNGKKVVVK